MATLGWTFMATRRLQRRSALPKCTGMDGDPSLTRRRALNILWKFRGSIGIPYHRRQDQICCRAKPPSGLSSATVLSSSAIRWARRGGHTDLGQREGGPP